MRDYEAERAAYRRRMDEICAKPDCGIKRKWHSIWAPRELKPKPLHAFVQEGR